MKPVSWIYNRSMDRILAALRRGTGLPFFAALTVGFMVLIILEGAIVRATGSGGGCGNHWPLCNGEILPHHPRLATVIEYTHRSLTGICSTLVVALIAWTFAVKSQGDRARRAVTWSGVLLVTEAILGAVLVKGGYVEHNASNMRVIMQCIHFTNTMLLLSAITLSWWWMRDRGFSPEVPGLHTVAWIALLASLLTGATGSEAAIADTLFPSPSLHAAFAADFAATAPLIIRMRWVHPATALLAFLCTLWLGFRLRSAIGRWIVALMGLQITLGVLDVLLLAPTWMQVVHLLGADLYWIALIAATSGIVFSPASHRARVVQPCVNPV